MPLAIATTAVPADYPCIGWDLAFCASFGPGQGRSPPTEADYPDAATIALARQASPRGGLGLGEGALHLAEPFD